jgi:hypothetical protein
MENTQEVAENKIKKPTRPSYRAMREKDREPVKGIFRFYEVAGGTLSFVFKCWKEDPVENFTLNDGAVYTLPLGVAKHLNKNGWYPIHSFAKNEGGENLMKVGQRVRRFGFQSLEFVDMEELAPEGKVAIEYTGI